MPAIQGSAAHLFYFDSGIGGLSGVKATREVGVRSDITYIGDSCRSPYGTKSEEELDRLGEKGMQHAASLGVDVVVPVCHTWETKARNYIGILPEHTTYIPLIESGAKGAVSEPNVRRIATVSTNATAESHAYREAIHKYDPEKPVTEVPGENLATLVEQYAEGEFPNRKPLEEEVRRVLKRVPSDTDLVIHACTHYSFLDREFSRFLRPGVRRVSSVQYQAKRVKKALGKRATVGSNKTRFYTTGNVKKFKAQVTQLLGIENPKVEHIDDFGDASL